MRERSQSGRGAAALAFAWFVLAAAGAAAALYVLAQPARHLDPVLVYSAAVPPPATVQPAPAELHEREADRLEPRLAGLQAAPLLHNGEASRAEDRHAARTEGVLPEPSVRTRPAWQRFAADYAAPEGWPRLALVVSGLGLSDRATEMAINRLPPEVTLSFSPYSRRLDEWIALARAQGHEVMLDLPMEPEAFPRDDPGPNALLTSLGPQENRARLHWILGRGSSYVGLTGVMGSRFVASEDKLAPVLKDIADKGLLFVDNRAGDGATVEKLAMQLDLALVVNDRTLDGEPAGFSALQARLAELERVALSNDQALAIAHPHPETIEHLAEWAEGLQARRIAVAPVSALLR